MITCGSRKYPYSPHGRSLELLGGGDLKANNLEAKYEAKLEFLRVRRVQNKTPSWGGGASMDIFGNYTLISGCRHNSRDLT